MCKSCKLENVLYSPTAHRSLNANLSTVLYHYHFTLGNFTADCQISVLNVQDTWIIVHHHCEEISPRCFKVSPFCISFLGDCDPYSKKERWAQWYILGADKMKLVVCYEAKRHVDVGSFINEMQHLCKGILSIFRQSAQLTVCESSWLLVIWSPPGFVTTFCSFACR